LKEAIRQTCRELTEIGTWPGQSVDHFTGGSGQATAPVARRARP
jgi:hypothetical protein